LAMQKLFRFLEEKMEKLLRRDSAVLNFAIERSVAQKARVVSEDEHESGTARNSEFGHTFATRSGKRYALSQISARRGRGLGMIAAARLASATGLFSARDSDRVERLISSVGPCPHGCYGPGATRCCNAGR